MAPEEVRLDIWISIMPFISWVTANLHGSQAISPLRIQKSTPNANAASPAPRSNGVSRPLADISPMGIRRNSPSYNQLTKVSRARPCFRRVNTNL